MSKLISVPAIISCELNISMGAPTVEDVVRLINKGEYTIEIYEPHGSQLSIVIKQKK